jgi:hypothetical protein
MQRSKSLLANFSVNEGAHAEMWRVAEDQSMYGGDIHGFEKAPIVPLVHVDIRDRHQDLCFVDMGACPQCR